MGEAPLWVFGYGSLIWEPGFDVAESRRARLHGFARRFCMRSYHHRGTEEVPGLVLALDADADAACDGLALRAAPGSEEATLDYLRERELVTRAYLERLLPAVLEDGGQVVALTYVMDQDHPQYCGRLPLADQAAIIARAHGGRGPNRDYLMNTARHLAELGIEDGEIAAIAAMLAEAENARE